MNLFGGLASAGRVVAGAIGGGARKAAKQAGTVAREQLGGEIQRVKNSLSVARGSFVEQANNIRGAAADAVAKAAVGAGVGAAARIGPQGNKYATVLPFLDDPKKRMWLIVGVVAVIAIAFLLYRSKAAK